MSMQATDLGVLGNLAVALGVFTPDGDPNFDWFGNPEASLKTMLADDDQRAALVAFVDEAMGGADRDTDSTGVVWLPMVKLDDPSLDFSITIDDTQSSGIDIGIGVAVNTSSPATRTTLSLPLFRAAKTHGPAVAEPFLLGQPGGRIRLSTLVTIDSGPAVPGQARLGAIGLDIDVPTSASDIHGPVFGLTLEGLQLPGATTPRTLRVSADGADQLDDALLDLVLSLLKAQADALGAGDAVKAVAGMLGLRSGDDIPDFPITQLPSQGVHALSAWLHTVLTDTDARHDWMQYLADLLGGGIDADEVTFDLGGAADLRVGLRVDTGPSGHDRVTPTLTVDLGDDDARVEARADLFQVDLVTGTTVGLPSLGVWAAAGRAVNGHRVLDITNPGVVRADTLRIGFALDVQRRAVFVLAADGVLLGTHSYATLDLTSPDAVMDAVGNTVAEVADELLGGFGTVVKTLLGLEAPGGVTAVTFTELLSDPVAAVAGYWHQLIDVTHRAQMPAVLAQLRNALADASQVLSAIQGDGSAGSPWRVALLGPLELQVTGVGDILSVGLAAVTRVDTLGERCTVVETTFAATIAELDLAHRSASVLPGVAASLTTRERGVNPPQARLALGNGVELVAGNVGLRLGWTPSRGLSAGVEAPGLTLRAGLDEVPIALPTLAADGTVTLPAEAWDGVELLVGHLAALTPGPLLDITSMLGWTLPVPLTSQSPVGGSSLRLADLVDDPATALTAWLPDLVLSELGPPALRLLADLFAGSGQDRGLLAGTGHPDDPYRLVVGDGLPQLAVWFPPDGRAPGQVPNPDALRAWRPGEPGLSPAALAAALQLEAAFASDVHQLIDHRDVAPGLAALTERWVGGDGRITPPGSAPDGVRLDVRALAAGQLHGALQLSTLIGHAPAVTVHVAVGADAWPDAPADRRVDLTTAGLSPVMFTVPTPVAGEWFVALGRRTDCLVGSSSSDGTAEQAARLSRLFDQLATVSNDITVVAVAGAGHAARLAAQSQTAITDVVTLGTPLGPIALTALSTQPTADAVRLLHRLLPPVPGTGAAAEDADLALGRALVASMMELVDRADPSAELRPPTAPLAAPRTGLTVTAAFGRVGAEQVARAITAIVAAGLAARARSRPVFEPADATGMLAGVRIPIATSATGALSVDGEALVTLIGFDRSTGVVHDRAARFRLRIADRAGWLTSTADMELRMVSADVTVPLDGTGTGSATITLHDARVFGQSWERLVLGTTDGAVPVLPEARTLLAAAIQRLTADQAGLTSVGLTTLLKALGVVAAEGGAVPDAIDQLIHDPGGLVRQRLASAETQLVTAIIQLLGPTAACVDLPGRSITIEGGGDDAGRFGWHAAVTAGLAGVTGHVQFGPNASSPTGALQLHVDLQPFTIGVQWHRPGGVVDHIAIWPSPDPGAIATAIGRAAPSLGGHAALELMRHADEAARPVIDAALDAVGLLSGAITDTDRRLRPLVGLLADPAGWLRSPDSIAAQPAKIQGLFDALRPLIGVAGAPGTPIPLANGVALAVTPSGSGARVGLAVDTGAWTSPGGGGDRLAAGAVLGLVVGSSGPPTLDLDLHVGLDGAPAGRQAVHLRLGTHGIELLLRPTAGDDIALIPFSGLGSLAAAAQAALPFLLDELADVNGTVGEVVGAVGDAFALRAGNPRRFDGTALANWARDPLASLAAAVPSIASTGLTTIAPLLDDFIPAGVTATATTSALTVTIGDVSLSWTPATGTVTLTGDGIDVPGIDKASFSIGISAAGLEDLTLTAGPASIDTGTVVLQPYVTVAAGLHPLGGRRIAVGMAADEDRRFAARWMLDPVQFDFVASDGVVTEALEDPDPLAAALRIVEVIADLVAAVAMSTHEVQEVLNHEVLGVSVAELLQGVMLEDVAPPTKLIDNLFEPSLLLDRVQRLVVNLAGAGLTVKVDGLTLSLLTIDGVIGLQLGLTERMALINSDVMLWLENDDSWIEGNPSGDGGLFLGVLKAAAPLAFTPVLVVNGVGLRVGKSSGPLLDFGISLDSIALHAYAELSPDGARGGGVQVQFSNLAVSAAGAKGQNGIAQGIMKDTGPKPPQPAFSPALAIQQHGNDPVSVTLRAGDGDGPWWIAIQKGFGPLYLEQIGFGVKNPAGRLEKISLLMDGSVSMFGLTCAVDDLQITYAIGNNDFFDGANWSIDLAGLAVSANMAGLEIAGGLLKQTTDQGIEYLGMLLARFGVYGITIYGGYGEGNDNGQKFTAFFAVGAINGPIGGPPAFFLTGIGGGFGINRRLIVPTDLSKFGDYPLIQALDIAAHPQEPMAQLRALGAAFPMQRGTFWFAAGISFNSFALVDGIAVLAVQIGDGLDINLLGLARMALPRPQVAIVSIELALLVRFSSSEGVMWVQGQLTDNSWLLYPDVRLTGGFAFVVWFKGEHRGEFVITLGGYHPDFHRPGYPEVPRLGLRWGIGDYIVIKAGSYFALTSEAVMAGGDFEASAHFGPAWAEVRFGAHGIVYFDPFRYSVMVYARISAGITIDTWIFGEITISISLGASIQVEGPDFHGRATFEVGPVELSVEFGSTEQTRKELLGPAAFIGKYLDTAPGGGALAHTAMTARGALPAGGEDSTPDGSDARPFVVVVEFALTFSSTVPATKVAHANGAQATNHAPSLSLGVAPMGTGTADPQITLAWVRDGATMAFPFVVTPRPYGRFPVGVWGPPQDDNNRKVPKADMIEALNELDLVSEAAPSVGGPVVPYHQVEVGPRLPLPFVYSVVDVNLLKSTSAGIAALLAAPATVSQAFTTAGAFMAENATPTALAALRGERQAPPRFGTLTERLDMSAITAKPAVAAAEERPAYDHFVDAPVAVGLLSGASVDLRVASAARTTVKDAARLWRAPAPTMASVEANRSRSIATRLVLTEPTAVRTNRAGTVIANITVPPTAVARAAVAMVATSGGDGSEHLQGFTSALTAGRRTARGTQGATVLPGQTAVLRMPSARRDAGDGDRPFLDVQGAPARVVALGHGGEVLFDAVVTGNVTGNVTGEDAGHDSDGVEIVKGTERILALGQGVAASSLSSAGLAGWHSGMQLPYAGWSSALGPGCVVRSWGEQIRLHRQRVDAGWVGGSELAAGLSTVTTRFSEPVTAIAVVLDDPAAFGDIRDGRHLVLGLDGAARATDAAGNELPPVLLTSESRSILVYDVVPDGSTAVSVTIASELGWSLVGVMGAAGMSSSAVLELIARRGLDAAVRPFAQGADGASRLIWRGATRTDRQRQAARSVRRRRQRR